jgi:hypothetical protein
MVSRHADLGMATSLLRDSQDGGYTTRDIVMLCVIIVAALIDLGIALWGAFLPTWSDGTRGMLLHVTTLLCETAILCVSVIVVGSAFSDGGAGFSTTTLYVVLSGISTLFGFALSAYGVRNSFRLLLALLKSSRKIVPRIGSGQGSVSAESTPISQPQHLQLPHTISGQHESAQQERHDDKPETKTLEIRATD